MMWISLWAMEQRGGRILKAASPQHSEGMNRCRSGILQLSPQARGRTVLNSNPVAASFTIAAIDILRSKMSIVEIALRRSIHYAS